MTDAIRIVGGEVYDPANDIDGEVRDICIDDGRIVRDAVSAASTIDARGMVVMPGGVDIHCHVASGAVNVARRLLPEEHAASSRARSCACSMGRARVGHRRRRPDDVHHRLSLRGPRIHHRVRRRRGATPGSRSRTRQLDDTPSSTVASSSCSATTSICFACIDAGEREHAREYAAWLLGATGAYAIKVVNPGGVELWKRGSREQTSSNPVGSSRVTPRAILETLVHRGHRASDCHTPHIFTATTSGFPATLRRRSQHGARLKGVAPISHTCSFTATVGRLTAHGRSGARELIEYVNAHQSITGDVGQVMFGSAATLTADAPVEYLLHRSSGRKWANVDIELETGCGVVPHEYKDRNAVAALQWAIGLELFLLASRSVARRAVHGPPERRLVHVVSGADPDC